MTKPASAPPAALLPCPFCGNPNVTDDEGCFPLNHARSRWEVRCGNPSCYAHEQEAGTHKDAVAKWNKRAASAQVREAEAVPPESEITESGYTFAELADPNFKPAAEPVALSDGGWIAYGDHRRIVTALEASLAACRADAERYRWLRHKLTCGHMNDDEAASIAGSKSPESLDAAIDALRQEAPHAE